MRKTPFGKRQARYDMILGKIPGSQNSSSFLTERPKRKERDNTMKAIRIHDRGSPNHLVYEDVPQPHPDPGEVLVRVYTTGIIVNELRWNETYETKAGSQRVLPIPGRANDFAQRDAYLAQASP